MALPEPLVRLRRAVGGDIFALMVACTTVHVAMLVAINGLHSSTVATVYDRWLALSWDALLSGRLWTLLTYPLLHDLDGISHLLFNLLGLYFFAPQFFRTAGRRGFWRLAASAAIAGGLLQLVWHLLVGHSHILVGISAVTMALLTVFALANPTAEVYLFFAIRVPARYLVPIVVALDVLGALSGSDVAVFGHLGGVAVGFLAAAGWKWQVARLRLLALLGKLPKRAPFEVIDGGRTKPSSRDKTN